jgi:hypothetical protein
VDDQPEGWARLLAASASERTAQPLRICRLCVDTLGVSGAGIAMVTPAGHRGVVCATDDISAKIEDLQLTLGEGPCIEAATSGAPVLIADLGRSAEIGPDMWPAFVEGALTAGVQAVFALPLRVGAVSVGVLDLYRSHPGELSAKELSGALMAADAGALALLHLEMEGDRAFHDDGNARSSFALQVHQATGMVMAQLDIGVEEAFLTLRARAFSEGRPLSELAGDLVAHRVRFTKEDE